MLNYEKLNVKQETDDFITNVGITWDQLQDNSILKKLPPPSLHEEDYIKNFPNYAYLPHPYRHENHGIEKIKIPSKIKIDRNTTISNSTTIAQNEVDQKDMRIFKDETTGGWISCPGEQELLRNPNDSTTELFLHYNFNFFGKVWYKNSTVFILFILVFLKFRHVFLKKILIKI